MKTTKQELQKQLNELQSKIDNFKEEPKFEIGKWYKFADIPDVIGCYKGDESYYGLDANYKWRDNLSMSVLGWWKLMTDKEVETALIKEAKKRGFKEGVKCNYPFQSESNGQGLKKDVDNLHFNPNRNVQITDGYGHCLLYKGKWAEIIEDTKPKINGYEMEVDGSTVKFGCKSFEKIHIHELYYSAKKCGICILHIDGYDITIGELKEVVNYLNK